MTYYKIFRTYMRSQRRVSRSSLAMKKDNVWKKVVQSTFFVPVLLILSFILLVVVPDLIVSVYKLSGRDVPATLEEVCHLMFSISDLCDVGIYVFMQRPVRNLLLKKCGLDRWFGNGSSEIENTSMSLRRHCSVKGEML